LIGLTEIEPWGTAEKSDEETEFNCWTKGKRLTHCDNGRKYKKKDSKSESYIRERGLKGNKFYSFHPGVKPFKT